MSGDFTFLKGNIETIILCSLINEDKYGYEIAKDIKNRTENKYQIKQPTLYSYLKRLEEDDLITSYWGESSNGGRRRYYRLTANGRSNCEQFISEWQYQRDVLSNLVDTSGEIRVISQEEATPLFGRRTNRKTHKNTVKSQLDEQDEIARRLAALAPDYQDEYSDDDTLTMLDESNQPELEVPAEAEAPQAEQDIIQPEQQIVAATVTEEPTEEEPATQPAATQTEALARFDIVQDTPDDFMLDFERRAAEASERQPASQDTLNGENYQHVLMGVIGDQLDDMQNYDTIQQQQQGNNFYSRRSAPLESIADSFAQEGVRMRIYNHATANYKSKMLVPQAKVLCQTAWITFLVSAIYFGILALTSISISNWQPFVITLCITLVLPIGFSIYALAEPGRKEKLEINFKKLMLAASILCGIIVLFAVAMSAFGNTQFSNYEEVSEKILIPVGIGLLLPTFVGAFYMLYKRY